MQHWESYKKMLLPTISFHNIPWEKPDLSDLLPYQKEFIDKIYDASKKTITYDMVEFYKDALANYKEADFYAFLQSPLNAAWKQVSELVTKGSVEARQMYRVGVEEHYAVLNFEKYGCKTISLSSILAEDLMKTECTFKLKDIKAPAPHVFIKIPRECGLTIPNYPFKDEITVAGVYVTWTKAGEATKQMNDLLRKHGAVKTKAGDVIPACDKIEGEEYEPIPQESIKDYYVDNYARFCIVARGKFSNKTHDWSTHYFNLHWDDNCEEDAENAFWRFTKKWEKLSEKLGGNAVSDDIRNKVFNLVANIFLYMSLPKEEVDMLWKPNEDRERLRTVAKDWNSKRRRHLREKISEEMPTEEWALGYNLKREYAPSEDLGGTHRSPRVHWRRGHWRGVWTGPMEGPRTLVPHLIPPVLVNPQSM